MKMMRSSTIKTQTSVLALNTGDKPFTPAGALHPAVYERVEARAGANDNFITPPAQNDNSPRDVRADMDARLGWLFGRAALDWFTGKPLLDGRSKPWSFGPVSYLALNVVIGAGAVAATAAVVAQAPAAAILVAPWTMLIATSRLRKHQTHLVHEAAHGNFFLRGDPRRKDKRLTTFVGALGSTVALSPSLEDYRAKHNLHHDAATYTTPDGDPDAKYVAGLKNFPGTLLDPRDYARDFYGRLKSNLLATQRVADADGRAYDRPNWLRRVMAAGWLAFLLALAGTMPASAWFAAVFTPYVVLYRVAGVLQILSLHRWNLPPAATHQEYAKRTFGRFSGVPLPPCGLEGWRWARSWAAWWAEMALIELPFRLGVLTSDLQAHDAHHLEWLLAKEMGALPQFVDDWRNQPFRRAQMIRDSGDPLCMAAREIWGFRAMWRIAQENLSRIGA
jgi:fatty acid desaturase